MTILSIIILCSLLIVDGFHQQKPSRRSCNPFVVPLQTSSRSRPKSSTNNIRQRSSSSLLFDSKNFDGVNSYQYDDFENNDSTDGNDDNVLSSSLGDWREFRAKLVQQQRNNEIILEKDENIVSGKKPDDTERTTTTSAHNNNNKNEIDTNYWAYDCSINVAEPSSSFSNTKSKKGEDKKQDDCYIEVGSIIISRSEQDFSYGLKQQYFHKSVILVIEHSQSTGFIKGIILNRPTNLILNDDDFVYDDGSSLSDPTDDIDDTLCDFTILDSHDDENQWHMCFGGDVQGIASPNPDMVCLHTLLSENKSKNKNNKNNKSGEELSSISKQLIMDVSKPIIDNELQYTTLEGCRQLISAGIAKSTDFYVYCGYSGWNYEQLQDEIQRKSWYIVQSSTKLIQDQLHKHNSKQMILNNELQHIQILEQQRQSEEILSIQNKKNPNSKKKGNNEEDNDQRQEQSGRKSLPKIPKYIFDPTYYIGLEFWEQLMILIGKEDEVNDSLGEFDDLMLREWANENLNYDYTADGDLMVDDALVDFDGDENDSDEDDDVLATVLDIVDDYYDDDDDNDDDVDINDNDDDNEEDDGGITSSITDDDIQKLLANEKSSTKDILNELFLEVKQDKKKSAKPLFSVGDVIRGSSIERSPFLLSDQQFHKSIILIIKDNDQATIGLILNQPLPKDTKLYLHEQQQQQPQQKQTQEEQSIENYDVEGKKISAEEEKEEEMTPIPLKTTIERIPQRYGGKYGIKVTRKKRNGGSNNKETTTSSSSSSGSSSTTDADDHAEKEDESNGNVRPDIWLHCNNNILKEAKVGEPIGNGPVHFGWGIWQCTREDAYKAIRMGYATRKDFMVIKGFTVWEKKRIPEKKSKNNNNRNTKKDSQTGNYADNDDLDDDEDDEFDYLDYYENNNDLNIAIQNDMFERVPTNRIRDIWTILSKQERLSTMSIDKNIMLTNDAWGVAGTEEEITKSSASATRKTLTNKQQHQQISSGESSAATELPIQQKSSSNQQPKEEQQHEEEASASTLPSSSSSSSKSSSIHTAITTPTPTPSSSTTTTTTTTTTTNNHEKNIHIQNDHSSSVVSSSNNKINNDITISNLCDDALRCWIAAYLLGKPTLRKTHNTSFG